MPGSSKVLADFIVDHFFRNSAVSSPSTLYVALHAAGGGVPVDPSDIAATAFASEVSWTSYGRQLLTFGTKSGTDTSIVTNSNAIAFPEVDTGEGPVTITGMSIWTADKGVDVGSSGNYLAHCAVSAVKTLADTDACLIQVGQITLTVGQ